MLFGLKSISIREYKEKSPLLLKEITTLELSNPKKILSLFGQNLFLYFFFLIT